MSHNSHELIAINQMTGFIDNQDTIGIAIKSNANIRAHFMNLADERFRRGRANIFVDVKAIGLIANVAVLLAGKTPVNLNFTAGRAATESAIKQSDMDCFLTADTFVRKMQSFPWPPLKQLTMLERLVRMLKFVQFHEQWVKLLASLFYQHQLEP